MSKGRSSFLDAAERILEEEGVPLKPIEICELARSKKLFVTKGKTPQNTMSAMINGNINRLKEKSRFVRAGKGRYKLA